MPPELSLPRGWKRHVRSSFIRGYQAVHSVAPILPWRHEPLLGCALGAVAAPGAVVVGHQVEEALAEGQQVAILQAHRAHLGRGGTDTRERPQVVGTVEVLQVPDLSPDDVLEQRPRDFVPDQHCSYLILAGGQHQRLRHPAEIVCDEDGGAGVRHVPRAVRGAIDHRVGPPLSGARSLRTQLEDEVSRPIVGSLDVVESSPITVPWRIVRLATLNRIQDDGGRAAKIAGAHLSLHLPQPMVGGSRRRRVASSDPHT